MGLGPQRKDSKTFGTTVYGLTHPTAALAVLGHLGAICLKNLNKHEEVRKGADQANFLQLMVLGQNHVIWSILVPYQLTFKQKQMSWTIMCVFVPT